MKHDIGNLRIIENKITNITDKTIVILCDTQSKNLVMDKNLILGKDKKGMKLKKLLIFIQSLFIKVWN